MLRSPYVPFVPAFLAAASLAVGAAPAPAQGADPSIPVVSARDLGGQSVRGTDGGILGDVQYVLVRLSDGAVRGLALQPEEDDRAQLMIVPWQSVEVASVRDDLRVTAQLVQTQRAPRLGREELAQLTQPATWTTVTEYWAPLATDVAAPGPGADEPRAQQGADAPSGRAGADPADAGEASAPSEARGRSASGAPSGQQDPTAGAGGEQAEPLVLVGRRIVTTVSGPEFQLAEELRGAEVVGSGGEEVGEIDDIVIDPRHGHVAYVVIAEGGFLGFGRSWYPVPVQTLAPGPEEGTLQLTAEQRTLKEFERLDASETPMQVERANLAQLYERFGVTPYWAAGSARAAGGCGGGGSARE